MKIKLKFSLRLTKIFRLIIFSVYGLMSTTIAGQTKTAEWFIDMGGSLTDQVNAMCIDKYENIYITGFFQGEISIDGVIYTSQGDTDIFLAKIDKNGSVQWFKQAGSDVCKQNIATEMGNSIALDSKENVLLCGIFSEKAQFGDTTIVSVGSDDAFVAKYSNGGQLIWVKGYGNIGCNIAQHIAIDTDQIIISGTSSDSFISANDSIIKPLAFLMCLDLNGNQKWFVEHEVSLMALNTMLKVNNEYVFWGSSTVDYQQIHQSSPFAYSHSLFIDQINIKDGNILSSKQFLSQPSSIKYKLFLKSDSVYIWDDNNKSISNISNLLDKSIITDEYLSNDRSNLGILATTSSLNKNFIRDSIEKQEIVTETNRLIKNEQINQSVTNDYIAIDQYKKLALVQNNITSILLSNINEFKIIGVSIENGQNIYLLLNYRGDVLIDESTSLNSDNGNILLIKYSLKDLEQNRNRFSDYDNPDKITVFPNPSKIGVFNLLINDNGLKVSNVVVKNSIDKIIYSKNNGNIPRQIDLSEQSAGIYFLIIESEDTHFSKKLIIVN